MQDRYGKAVRWRVAVGLLALIVALAAIALLWRRDPPAPHPVAATPPAEMQPAAPSPAAVFEPPPAPPASAPSVAVATLRRPQDLFGAFQLALGSTQLATIEKGIAAYEECFLYATPDGIEGYVAKTIPDGLDKAEWERRATALRSRARRCAGFANQDLAARLRELQDAAIAAGSVAERSRRVAEEPQSADEQSTVACAIVQGLPASRAAIRFIGPALTRAAATRESHVLRSAPPPVPALAVSLALCDLDPDACRRMLGLADSACAEEGLCNLGSDRDYLQRATPPDTFAAAVALSQEIEALVARRDCPALFQ